MMVLNGSCSIIIGFVLGYVLPHSPSSARRYAPALSQRRPGLVETDSPSWTSYSCWSGFDMIRGSRTRRLGSTRNQTDL